MKHLPTTNSIQKQSFFMCFLYIYIVTVLSVQKSIYLRMLLFIIMIRKEKKANKNIKVQNLTDIMLDF